MKTTTYQEIITIQVKRVFTVIETTGEEAFAPAVLIGPGIAKCRGAAQVLRLAGGAR